MLMKVPKVDFSNEHGVTLVELLASIVLITLILTTFITVFIQSAKTYKTSEHIIDATYIAQTEMEKIYAVSVVTEYGGRKEAMTSEPLGYHYKGSKEDWLVYEKKDDHYMIQVKLQELRMEIPDPNDPRGTQKMETDMNRMIVEVLEGSGGKVNAKMQGILHWGSELK